MDFDIFGQEGYEAERAAAFMGCVNQVLAKTSVNYKRDRATYLIVDETPLFAKNTYLAKTLAYIAKIGRKMRLCLWLATTSLETLTTESNNLLSLIETWACLSMSPANMEEMERFKSLTTLQRDLLFSLKMKQNRYTECALFNSKQQSLLQIPLKAVVKKNHTRMSND